jgi:hypothetical protein
MGGTLEMPIRQEKPHSHTLDWVATFALVKKRISFETWTALRRKGVLHWGSLCLVLAFSIQAAVWGIRSVGEFRESAVSANVIAAPGPIATCPHHEHGCPKDCMCPKTYESHSETDGIEKSTGVIREPALVACTEHGPQSASCDSEIFIVAEPFLFRVVLSESPSVPGLIKAPLDRAGDPPQKVPIA